MHERFNARTQERTNARTYERTNARRPERQRSQSRTAPSRKRHLAEPGRNPQPPQAREGVFVFAGYWTAMVMERFASANGTMRRCVDGMRDAGYRMQDGTVESAAGRSASDRCPTRTDIDKPRVRFSAAFVSVFDVRCSMFDPRCSATIRRDRHQLAGDRLQRPRVLRQAKALRSPVAVLARTSTSGSVLGQA